MPDFLKPYISRVIASAIAGFVAWLAAKNINIDGDTQQQLAAAITGIASAIFGVVYAVLHKLLDKQVNPTDAAAKANIQHGEVVNDKAIALKQEMK